jgi:hypothetical protein
MLLPILPCTEIMISPQIFKPSLEITPQGLLRVVLSMADISAHELTKCLAMTNREIAKFFCDIGVRKHDGMFRAGLPSAWRRISHMHWIADSMATCFSHALVF